MATMEKLTLNLHPLTELHRRRWSPTVFEDKAIPEDVMASLFEAARWSASCFNEQPWNFVVAARHSDPESFAALLDCLRPGNQAWAKNAPVLMFSVARRYFEKTGASNRYAWYDTGQSVAHLSLEAVSLGIFVHQMAGFEPMLVQAVAKIPDTYEVVSAIALGYGVEAGQLSPEASERENSPRTRRETGAFVFNGHF
jgi:nitroreductase